MTLQKKKNLNSNFAEVILFYNNMEKKKQF